MERRAAIRAIGAAIAMAALGGCASTTGGSPTAVTDRTDASVPWDGAATTSGTAPTAGPSVTTGPSVSTATPTGPTTSSGPVDLSGEVTGSITWNTGSMPPPYNYSWTATFTATSGTFALHTNYAAKNGSWSHDLAVTPAKMAALTAALAAAGVGAEGPPSDEHLVGGSTGSYQLTTAEGRKLHASLGDSATTSTELQAVADAVRAFVGGAVWNAAMDSYQTWADQYHG
jgi:hypothetical protein